MDFKKQDLLKNNWTRLKKKITVVEDIKTNLFEGKICFLMMIEVDDALVVDGPLGNVKIADNGYSNLIIAPKNKNWWLTVMFDNDNNYIESYFDITRENVFIDEANPYFIDLKLDVSIPTDLNIYILDEDELKEVYDNGLISLSEYNMAYETAKKIIKYYNENKGEYFKFINDHFNRMLKQINNVKV